MRLPSSVCFCFLLFLTLGLAEEPYDAFIKAFYSKNQCTYGTLGVEVCDSLMNMIQEQIKNVFGEADSMVQIIGGASRSSSLVDVAYVITMNTTINGRRARISLFGEKNRMNFELKVKDEMSARERFSDWDFWINDSPLLIAEKREISGVIRIHNVTLLRSGVFMKSARISEDAAVKIEGVQEKDENITPKGQKEGLQKSFRQQMFDTLQSRDYFKLLKEEDRDDWVNASGLAARNVADTRRKEDTIVALENACRLILNISNTLRSMSFL